MFNVGGFIVENFVRLIDIVFVSFDNRLMFEVNVNNG